MDISEGWGIVIGAVCTGVFVLAAGVVAYRAGRRQVADQADAERRAWLRQRREEAYTAMLAAGDEVQDALSGVLAIRDLDDYETNLAQRVEAWRPVNAALKAMLRAGRRVSIVGPSERMPELARELYEAVHAVADTQRAPGLNGGNARLVAFVDAMSQRDRAEEVFVAEANRILHSAEE
ncbi:MAG TPA: hypothetical protein VFY14_18945 [Streptomyces sp.]|nr:hypothetical protein [Streptomyces sp.]